MCEGTPRDGRLRLDRPDTAVLCEASGHDRPVIDVLTARRHVVGRCGDYQVRLPEPLSEPSTRLRPAIPPGQAFRTDRQGASRRRSRTRSSVSPPPTIACLPSTAESRHPYRSDREASHAWPPVPGSWGPRGALPHTSSATWGQWLRADDRPGSSPGGSSRRLRRRSPGRCQIAGSTALAPVVPRARRTQEPEEMLRSSARSSRCDSSWRGPPQIGIGMESADLARSPATRLPPRAARFVSTEGRPGNTDNRPSRDTLSSTVLPHFVGSGASSVSLDRLCDDPFRGCVPGLTAEHRLPEIDGQRRIGSSLVLGVDLNLCFAGRKQSGRSRRFPGGHQL